MSGDWAISGTATAGKDGQKSYEQRIKKISYGTASLSSGNRRSGHGEDKLLAKICALSKELRFDELRKVLESYGYQMYAPRSGSSHYIFRKAGCRPITIPKHEPIKKVYVELVKQVVESEAENDENAV